MEADSVGRRLADFLAALGDELIGPADLLSVIAEHNAAFVNEAEGTDVAVVAGLEAARIIVLIAADLDILDAFAERSVGENVRRICIREDERAVRRGGPKSVHKVVRKLGRGQPGAAAVDDEALGAV